MKPFWTIRAAADDESAGEVYIYGVIEGDPAWFEDDTTPMGFVRDLEELGDVDRLDVRINSPGGDVFAGQVIYSVLRRHDSRKVITVDGLAASIASIVAMAGDEVVMPVNSMMMIHNPWGLSLGDSNDHRKTADYLDSIREGMIAAYRDKTGLRRNQIIKMLDEETWMTADEAKEQGFADRVDSRRVTSSMANENLWVVNGLGVQLDRYETRPPVHLITEPYKENAESLIGVLSAFEARTFARAETRGKAGRALGKTDLAYWQKIRDAADRVLDGVGENVGVTTSTSSAIQVVEDEGMTSEERLWALKHYQKYVGGTNNA